MNLERIWQHPAGSHPVTVMLSLEKGNMPMILHSLLPMVQVCMPMSCFLRRHSGKIEYAHVSRCCSPHLQEQYAHDIALCAPDESRMPMYDDQVELSRVDAVKSGLLSLL